jgi:hypothetical protein
MRWLVAVVVTGQGCGLGGLDGVRAVEQRLAA